MITINFDWKVNPYLFNKKTFPRYWPFVRGTHRSHVEGQWRGALMFSLIFDLQKDVWTSFMKISRYIGHDTHKEHLTKCRCSLWSPFGNFCSAFGEALVRIFSALDISRDDGLRTRSAFLNTGSILYVQSSDNCFTKLCKRRTWYFHWCCVHYL